MVGAGWERLGGETNGLEGNWELTGRYTEPRRKHWDPPD